MSEGARASGDRCAALRAGARADSTPEITPGEGRSAASSSGVRRARLPALPWRAEPAVAAAAAAPRLHNRAAGRARSPSADPGNLPAPAGAGEPARLPRAGPCQPGRNSFWREVGFLCHPRLGGAENQHLLKRGFHVWVLGTESQLSLQEFLPGCSLWVVTKIS